MVTVGVVETVLVQVEVTVFNKVFVLVAVTVPVWVLEDVDVKVIVAVLV